MLARQYLSEKICRNIDNFATSEVYKNGTKPSTVSQARKPVFCSLLKETTFSTTSGNQI
jgi:hypothetical protein